jgi:hypothetical protein
MEAIKHLLRGQTYEGITRDIRSFVEEYKTSAKDSMKLVDAETMVRLARAMDLTVHDLHTAMAWALMAAEFYKAAGGLGEHAEALLVLVAIKRSVGNSTTDERRVSLAEVLAALIQRQWGTVGHPHWDLEFDEGRLDSMQDWDVVTLRLWAELLHQIGLVHMDDRLFMKALKVFCLEQTLHVLMSGKGAKTKVVSTRSARVMTCSGCAIRAFFPKVGGSFVAQRCALV